MHITLAQVDRGMIRAEIEATRDSFRDLVNNLPEAAWLGRAPDSKWTGKQLLHHVTWALEQLPRELNSAKNEKGMFNYPKFIADPGSYWLVKWEARRQTRESLVMRYDVAVTRTLEALEQVEERHWGKGARFYGEGFFSLADLFHTPANHFQEHAAALARL